MKKEALDRLLAKYYNGESTEEEEDFLRVFFTAGDIPPGYEAEADIFKFYSNHGEVPEPSSDFEKRIYERIDMADGQERTGTLKKYLITFLSSAAAIAVLVVSYFLFQQGVESRDTYTDPKIAYAETMKVLMNVSTRLNQGVRALEPVGKINDVAERSIESLKSINKTTGMVDRNLKTLNYLEKVMEFTSPADMAGINKK
jgi:hypothetical protein